MKLGIRILDCVVDVNHFEPTTTVEWTEGDSPAIYFQLVDERKDKANEGFSPPFRRFMPATGATMAITLESIDDAKRVTRAATQPFSNDASIWMVDVLSTDLIGGTINMRVVLTEDSVVTNAYKAAAARVAPTKRV